LETGCLPSLPDDKGFVALLSAQGSPIDALSYSKDWHNPLLTNEEGVSLERIDVNSGTQNSNNWQSAPATAGLATPTGKNAQTGAMANNSGSFHIWPEVISTNNDGIDDYTQVFYKLPSAGFVVNIRIYDLGGRPVRRLVNNGLAGREGFYKWDGLNDQGKELSTGIYVMAIEWFNANGQTGKTKKTVVLAKKR
jgi:hypothetical protein